MKANVHPKYVDCTVVCGCGTTFKTRSTRERIAVEICSSCHPFFTGKQKFVDTAGMVEKFQKKYAAVADQVAAKQKKADDAKARARAEQELKLAEERRRKEEERKKRAVERDAWAQRQAAAAARKAAEAEQASLAAEAKGDAAAAQAASSPPAEGDKKE
jgi:large subunit ribosomal protein L31